MKADPDSQLGWWSTVWNPAPSWLVGPRCRTAPRSPFVSSAHCRRGGDTEPEMMMDGSMLVASWSERGVRRGLSIDTSRPVPWSAYPLPRA